MIRESTDNCIPSVSIIIPAFNEERLIVSTIKAVKEYLIENITNAEIIIVNDGSTDQTQTNIQALITDNRSAISLKLINNKTNQGKGYSVKHGMLSSTGEVRVFMDADLPFDLNVVQEIHTKIRTNHMDVVIGDRNNPRSMLVDVHPIRKIAGKIYSAFVQLVITGGITDTQCGLKGFNAASAEFIFSRTRINGFGFDVEMLRIAQKHNLSISKVPVHMINNRLDSRVQLLWDSLLMLLNLMHIKINEWFGYYD